MAGNGARSFTDSPATREQTPLLVGLVGASGSGKTYSAHRLAAGIQSVTGGDIYFIDTEARRALHYADQFKFRHVPFAAPFGPLDYLAAVEHCVRKGARTIVIDSLSHEHEGPGGVLEMHAAEVDRMAKGGDPNRYNMLAWQKPKSERRRFLNTLLQIPANFIFCFRAKEKVKIVPGKNPVPLGWMPIAGEEFVYEMSLNCLLYPASNGVPTWKTEEPGERVMIKLPSQFRDIFARPEPLSEDIGASLARWAAGEGNGGPKWAKAVAAFAAKGASEVAVLGWLGLANAADVTDAHLARMRTFLTAVKAGSASMDELTLAHPDEGSQEPDGDPADDSQDLVAVGAGGDYSDSEGGRDG